MTTYRSYVDGLETLAVSGVTRRYTTGMPAALNTADLPAQWVQAPAGSDAAVARGTANYWPTLRADLVIAFEAAGQNTQPVNFDGCVDLMDALGAALPGLGIGKTAPSWSIRLGTVNVAGSEYWAVMATVEVEG
jgi:hypothetical protein